MDEHQSDPSGLQHLTRRTLGHYETRAEAFRSATRDHDVRQNIDALRRHRSRCSTSAAGRDAT
jgi:hypothetical protein